MTNGLNKAVAEHGHAAAEIVALCADNKKPLMGLASFRSDYITATDVLIAKKLFVRK